MRRTSGASSIRTQNTPVAHPRFTTGLRHHETDSGKLLCGKKTLAAKSSIANGRRSSGSRAVCGGKGNKGKSNKGKKGKDKGKGKHRNKQENIANEATVESGAQAERLSMQKHRGGS